VIQVRGQAFVDAHARHEDPAPPARVGLRTALRGAALGVLAASLLASAAPAAAPAAAASASASQAEFGFESVRALARELAAQPYRAPENTVPQVLLDLDYDAHRDIRFKPPRSIWRAEKLPFQLQFFHLGLFSIGQSRSTWSRTASPDGFRSTRVSSTMAATAFRTRSRQTSDTRDSGPTAASTARIISTR
jgi:hypothetical protein